MALNTGKILMRRGQEVNFDPDKMSPGEWAVSLDTKYVRMCFAPGICVRMATYEAFEADVEEIQQIIEECRTIDEAVTRINDEITDKAEAVAEYTEQARQYRDEAKQYRDESQQFLNSYSENILDTLEEIEANTEPGKPAGALAIKELNESLVSLITPSDAKMEFGKVTTEGSTRVITLQNNYEEMLYFNISWFKNNTAFIPRGIVFTAPNTVSFNIKGFSGSVVDNDASAEHGYIFVGK